MIACDATFLSQLFNDKCVPPHDIAGKPVEGAKERILYFVKTLSKQRTVIVVPTPALSELLTILDEKAIPDVLNELRRSSRFKVEAFDEKAAIEAAIMTKSAFAEGHGKKDALQSNWSKIKFDRQIMAIARALGVDTLYSDDIDMVTHGKRAGIRIVRTEELPIPPDMEEPPLIKAMREASEKAAAEKAAAEKVATENPPKTEPENMPKKTEA